MKSGYDKYEGMWGDPYYDDEATPLKGLSFAHRIFTAAPALVPLNPKPGPRVWHEFKGQPYDPQEWRLEPKRWDHQHCCVCRFSIEEGMTYWSTEDDRHIHCDACHDHYFHDQAAEKRK